jgi:RimJ/RimL family protein N-acetyltransferase
VIETARIVLRAWRDEDLEPFAALNADPVVMEHLPSVLARAESDELAGRIRTAMAAQGFGLWAVAIKGGAPFVGFVGLSVPKFDAPFMPAVEIGWRLARGAWGHGYATEAARAALEAGFTRWGLDEIVSFTVPQNLRSRRVMDRIGMRLDGEFDHPRLPEGHPLRRHVLYRARKGPVSG